MSATRYRQQTPNSVPDFNVRHEQAKKTLSLGHMEPKRGAQNPLR
jgi:hypothetical protein